MCLFLYYIIGSVLNVNIVDQKCFLNLFVYYNKKVLQGQISSIKGKIHTFTFIKVHESHHTIHTFLEVNYIKEA